MNKKSNLYVLNYLEHILIAIKRIHHYINDIDESTFLQNELIQDGVIRNIEIIGEAARNIERYYPHLTGAYPEVPWSDLYWMRNRVTHGYFSIDLELVWKTLEKDIPDLQMKIEKIYHEQSLIK